MELKLLRFADNLTSTAGLLFAGEKFQCFTVEDEFRAHKIPGSTRIPEGKYEVTLRTIGEFHERYKKRFPFHKGMLWIREVPEFDLILIHIGNTPADTKGCILVGDQISNPQSGEASVSFSAQAYSRIYPPIATSIFLREPCWIEIGGMNK